MEEITRSTKKKKPKRLWLKIFIAIILLTIVVLGAYFFSIYNNAKQTVTEEIHQTVPSIDIQPVKEKVSEKESLNILVLGVDQRPENSGRSDALMVVSLDPNEEKMQIVSIPRDTRTLIVGKGYEDKINHAFAYGGTDMSIATVENLLDIELDYYIEMNMEGLSDMVDAIGGITVTNELDWYDEGYYEKGYHYKQGEIELDGPKTMGYVRMRYQDPDGDFGRTKRQRQVIEAILEKGANINSVSKINNMITVLGSNMATNMDFEDMKNLLFDYKDVRKNVTSYMMKGTGTKIDGVYYFLVPQEEILKVHDMISDVKS